MNRIYKSLPEADVLIHAGDLTYRGDIPEMSRELRLLGEAGKNYQRVIVICGNHDWLGQKDPNMMKLLCEENNIIWLQDSQTEVDGVKIYGSAWTPEFMNWAFNLSRYDNSLQDAWAKIPDDTQVLITHGPPLGILDLTQGYGGEAPEHVGCYDLNERVQKFPQLKLHCFGHIHHSYGQHRRGEVEYVNASICDEQYHPSNPPVVIELDL